MATSLAELITLVRQRSDTENNYFVSDAELTTYINNSLAELDDLLTIEYEDYRLTNFLSVLPEDGISNIIPIPSTMNKLRGVDFQASVSGPWYTLQPFQFTQRNRNNNLLTNITVPWGKVGLSYRLADQGIIISPQTQAGGTYQIWYTPKFINLTATTDLIPISMDLQSWVEYAVVDCAIKIYNKQNLDPSAFMTEKQLLRQRIISAAKNRNAAGPKVIANTRYNTDDLILPYYYDVY